jgi:hypothetical protein
VFVDGQDDVAVRGGGDLARLDLPAAGGTGQPEAFAGPRVDGLEYRRVADLLSARAAGEQDQVVADHGRRRPAALGLDDGEPRSVTEHHTIMSSPR